MTEKEEEELWRFYYLAPRVYEILEKYFNCTFTVHERAFICEIYVSEINPLFARIQNKDFFRYTQGIYIIKNLYLDNREENLYIQTTCSTVEEFEFFTFDELDKLELYVQKLVKQIKDLQIEKHITAINKDFE